MLELYGRETSSNVQAVRWALLELNIPFKRLDVGGEFGGLDTPGYLALNPNGKIPTIVDDGQAIFESSAILRYLGARYGNDGFWPADPMARAQVDKWAEWAKRDIADAFTGPIFWRVVRTPELRHDKPAIRAAVDAFEAALTIAEPQLAKSRWLAGGALTPADIVFGHVLYRYFDIEIARRPFPNTRAYYDRLTQNPHYAEAVIVSYDSLRDTI